jgi:hypothetical protein
VCLSLRPESLGMVGHLALDRDDMLALRKPRKSYRRHEPHQQQYGRKRQDCQQQVSSRAPFVRIFTPYQVQ